MKELAKKFNGSFQLGWPAVVLASVLILAITALLIFAPANVREQALEALGWVAYVVSQIMGPIIRRRLESETNSGESEQ